MVARVWRISPCGDIACPGTTSRIGAESPSNAAQALLAKSHHSIGRVLEDTGKPAEALRAYERARDIHERLARDNPSVTRSQSDLARSHGNIGVLLNDTGRPAEALAAYERARDISERLAREHPDSPGHASDLGGTLNNLGRIPEEPCPPLSR